MSGVRDFVVVHELSSFFFQEDDNDRGALIAKAPRLGPTQPYWVF